MCQQGKASSSEQHKLTITKAKHLHQAATSTLVLITQLQGIGGRRKAAVRPDCISAKISLPNCTTHDVCSFCIHGNMCVYFPLKHRACALLEAAAATRGRRRLVYCLLCTAAATPAIPRPGCGASFPYEKPALSLATGFPVSSAS